MGTSSDVALAKIRLSWTSVGFGAGASAIADAALSKNACAIVESLRPPVVLPRAPF